MRVSGCSGVVGDCSRRSQDLHGADMMVVAIFVYCACVCVSLVPILTTLAPFSLDHLTQGSGAIQVELCSRYRT